MTKKEFLDAHPNADFIAYIKVGNKGVDEFYTNRKNYKDRRNDVLESGHDFECSILKGTL